MVTLRSVGTQKSLYVTWLVLPSSLVRSKKLLSLMCETEDTGAALVRLHTILSRPSGRFSFWGATQILVSRAGCCSCRLESDGDHTFAAINWDHPARCRPAERFNTSTGTLEKRGTSPGSHSSLRQSLAGSWNFGNFRDFLEFFGILWGFFGIFLGKWQFIKGL